MHLTAVQFTARLAGALTGPSLQLVELHLEQCDDCRNHIAMLALQDEALADVLTDDPGEDYLDELVMSVTSSIDEGAAKRIAARRPPRAPVQEQPLETPGEPARPAPSAAEFLAPPPAKPSAARPAPAKATPAPPAAKPPAPATPAAAPAVAREPAAAPKALVAKPAVATPPTAPAPPIAVAPLAPAPSDPVRRLDKASPKPPAARRAVPAPTPVEPPAAPPAAEPALLARAPEAAPPARVLDPRPRPAPPSPPAPVGTPRGPRTSRARVAALFVVVGGAVAALLWTGARERTSLPSAPGFRQEAPASEPAPAVAPPTAVRAPQPAATPVSPPAAAPAPRSEAPGAPPVTEHPAEHATLAAPLPPPASPRAARPAERLAPTRAAARAPAPVPPPPSARGLVNGVVIDENGQPVVAATVMLADIEVAARTDRAGRFCLSVPVGDRTLTVACMGFRPLHQVVSVTGRTPELTLTLRAAAAPVPSEPTR